MKLRCKNPTFTMDYEPPFEHGLDHIYALLASGVNAKLILVKSISGGKGKFEYTLERD